MVREITVKFSVDVKGHDNVMSLEASKQWLKSMLEHNLSDDVQMSLMHHTHTRNKTNKLIHKK